MRRLTPYPVSELSLLNYLAHRQSTGMSVSSLQVGVHALRYHHIMSGLNTSVFTSPKVKLLLQGALRLESSVSKGKARNGVTLNQPRVFATRLQATRSRYDAALYWSAITLAYHGLLRVGEYTSDCPDKRLSLERIQLDADTVTLELPFTKTAQHGQGNKVTVARTHTHTCPVTALNGYLALRGRSPGTLFLHQFGRPLKAAEVNALLRAALPGAGISSHSLQIGAATTASKRGVSDQSLKAAGRWSSDAFQRYIRFDDSDNRNVSLMIA